MKLWSLQHGRCIETFHGDAPFTGLQLSSDGNRLWALERSGTIRILDLSPLEPRFNAAGTAGKRQQQTQRR